MSSIFMVIIYIILIFSLKNLKLIGSNAESNDQGLFRQAFVYAFPTFGNVFSSYFSLRRLGKGFQHRCACSRLTFSSLKVVVLSLVPVLSVRYSWYRIPLVKICFACFQRTLNFVVIFNSSDSSCPERASKYDFIIL
jgi:hypothetical protein